jgi:hypothetical protein
VGEKTPHHHANGLNTTFSTLICPFLLTMSDTVTSTEQSSTTNRSSDQDVVYDKSKTRFESTQKRSYQRHWHHPRYRGRGRGSGGGGGGTGYRSHQQTRSFGQENASSMKPSHTVRGGSDASIWAKSSTENTSEKSSKRSNSPYINRTRVQTGGIHQVSIVA